MTIFNVISLCGGLALFLYGMTVMEQGLERASGGRLETLLEQMTGNLFKAIFFGMTVTAAIQSSSGTTVIVVGLVNAKVLGLHQAIGVIMGANIGTTVTAHLLRLTDLESSNALLQLLNPKTLSPLAAAIGILLYLTAKKPSRRDIGLVLLGFGILFQGMFAMEAAVRPLQTAPQFVQLFASLRNPLLGVLVGALVTAIIQSSSASIGILQALTATGVLTFSNAFPIIMGQNIGTCVTPMLASIGASKNAKRTAVIHVSFNTIGSLLFLGVAYLLQSVIGFAFWDAPISKGGIANFHTFFNLAATLFFIPFAGLLEKLSYLLVKQGKEEQTSDRHTAMLDERFLGSPGYAIQQARGAVAHMAELSLENYHRSVELLKGYDKKKMDLAHEVENTIDRLQSKVDQFLLKLTTQELTEAENVALSEVLQVVNEFERIGDHAENLCETAQHLSQNRIVFSESAWSELDALTDAVTEILELGVTGYIQRDLSLAVTIEPLEEVIDILVEALKVRHSERLRDGLCSVDHAFPYLETLYNLERIADHCSNVGVHVISYGGTGEVLDRHEYLRGMRANQPAEYRQKFNHYDQKYFERIKYPNSPSKDS